MRIAILGTGRVRSALASRWVDAGHAVIVGSRSPQEGVTVSHSDAVEGADVIVTAVPGSLVLDSLDAIGADAIGDKIILEVSNALLPDFTLAYPNDSVARQVQQRFPKARVVKSLNTVNTSVMVGPPGQLADTTLFVSGDDAEAKNVVVGIISDLGWPETGVIDLGGIETARGPEHYFFLFLGVRAALNTPTLNLKIVH